MPKAKKEVEENTIEHASIDIGDEDENENCRVSGRKNMNDITPDLSEPSLPLPLTRPCSPARNRPLTATPPRQCSPAKDVQALHTLRQVYPLLHP